jgi:serine phosphatase RsbU (regulator of sigma subunit)
MLNTKIRLSLRQEEKYNADGMDVCFCLLEPMPGNEETLVSFTGARRPLYYKINQETALKELKGDRKIIGGWHRKKRAFTNQSLLLPKGAAIYLTTDGLVGLASPDGTKFSSLRIKDFFDKHAHLPMLEQKKLLEKTISEHQQGIEQRDDMTIMGIRL